jgi:hypothetical protein
MVRDRPGGDAQLLGNFPITHAVETVQQEGFPGARIGGRQTSLDTLDQLMCFGILFSRARRVPAISLIKGLVGEDALRQRGVAETIDAHFLRYIHEKSDRITDRRLLLLLITGEPEKALLNQLVNLIPARISALEQATPKKGQLFLETIGQGYFILSFSRGMYLFLTTSRRRTIALVTGTLASIPP